MGFKLPFQKKEKLLSPTEFIQVRKATKQETKTYDENTGEKEYDFSKGERGKFFRTVMKLNMPFYLEEGVSAFVEKIAAIKGMDRSTVVNEILRSDIKRAEVIEPT